MKHAPFFENGLEKDFDWLRQIESKRTTVAFKLFAKCSEITTDDESIWRAGPCWNENNRMYYSDGLTSAILIGISFPWLLFSLNAYYQTAKGNSEIETTTVSPDNDSNVDFQKA